MSDYRIEESAGSSTLVVAFTSYGYDDAPAEYFEWWATLQPFDAHRLYVLDSKQHWYLSGVPGLGADPAAVGTSIRSLASELRAQRIVTLGSSMGGFGALLVGGLADADEAVTFGANATAELAFVERHGDWRCRHKYEELAALNLGRGLGPTDKTPVFCNYFDPAFARDALQAEILQHLPKGRQVHTHGAGHNVADHLKKQGRLHDIVAELIRPTAIAV